MRKVRRRRKRGPEPMPQEDRRSLLVGVKVSPAELGAFRSAARNLPVATWMRSRALEALEVESAREKAETFLTQAKAFRDRATEALDEMDRKLGTRIAAVDRLLARASRLKGPRGRPRRPAASARKRARDDAQEEVIRQEAGAFGQEGAMPDHFPTEWHLDALLKRAERSRAEAERWFRFVKRFDESRRTGRDLAAARRDLAIAARKAGNLLKS